MITILLHLLRLLPFLCGGHRQLALENLALRQQLAVYQRTTNRPKLQPTDPLLWVWLSRVWPAGRQALVIVAPATVLRWQQHRFRRHWATLSGRPPAGHPPVDAAIKALVRRMAAANPLWGAPRIHGELLKLGIDVAERTVSRLLPKRRSPPSQTWRTFLTITSGTSSPSISSRFPPRACAFCSSSSCSPTTAGASSTSISPSIPLLPGRLSRSWTPSRTTPPRPTSSAIATRSTVTCSSNV